MSISIILPTYQRLELFKKCIESVNKFNNKNFLLIIIDDGSENEIVNEKENYLSSFSLNYKFIKNEKNYGQIYSMNKGINLVNTDYFTWISDDNIYYPNFLDNFFLNGDDFDFFYTGFLIRKLNGSSLEIKHQYRDLRDLLFKFRGLGSYLWRTNFFREYVIRFDEKYVGAEDLKSLYDSFKNTNKISFRKEISMEYFENTYSNEKLESIKESHQKIRKLID